MTYITQAAEQNSGEVSFKKTFLEKTIELFKPSSIVIYPLNESEGAAALDYSGHTYNASYGSTKTLEAYNFLFGGKYANIANGLILPHAQLNASDLDMGEMTVVTWFKFNSTRWTSDNVTKTFSLFCDGSNRFFSRLSPTNPSWETYYIAGGTYKTFNMATVKHDKLFCMAMSVSVYRDELNVYINGTKHILPRTGLGTWSGDLTEALWSDLWSSYYFDGGMAYVMILDHGINDAEAWLLAGAEDVKGQLIFVGDSRTSGKSWIQTVYGAVTPFYGVADGGISGDTLADMIARVADIDNLRREDSNDIVVAWGGVNSPGTSAEDLYAELVTFCEGRQAEGFKVIACTEIDAQDATRTANGWSEKYLDLNTLIRNGYTDFADGLADLGGNAALQNATDTTYFNADKVHLNEDGYDVVAGIVTAAVEELL